MSETETGISEGRLIFLFTAALIGASVLLMVLSFLLQMLLDIDFSNNAMGIIIIMCSAMLAGDVYFKKTGTMPARSFAWKMAAKFTVVNFVLSFLLVSVFILIGGISIPQHISSDGVLTMGIIVALVIILPLLLTRLGFYLGARSAKKNMERLAEKAAKADKIP